MFAKLPALPKVFFDWAHQRKIELKDLLPLNALSDLAPFISLAQAIADLQLSRNDGKQVIDLLVDLLLLDHSPKTLLEMAGTDWPKTLEKVRKPMAHAEPATQSNSAWPSYVGEQKFRQGDRWQHRLQISYHDTKDLQKKLVQLSQRMDDKNGLV